MLTRLRLRRQICSPGQGRSKGDKKFNKIILQGLSSSVVYIIARGMQMSSI